MTAACLLVRSPACHARQLQTSRPKPNIRDTRGKVMGQHFAEWAEGEGKKAESRCQYRVTTLNRA